MEGIDPSAEEEMAGDHGHPRSNELEDVAGPPGERVITTSEAAASISGTNIGKVRKNHATSPG